MQIPREIFHSFVAAVDGGNIKTMPNRSMPAAPYPTPGALLMGDAFNMRHPLTGGGMTVALSDIVILRSLLRHLSNLNDAPALCNYLESFYTLRKVTCKISCKSTVSSVFLASSFPWLCCLHMESYSHTNLMGSLDCIKIYSNNILQFPFTNDRSLYNFSKLGSSDVRDCSQWHPPSIHWPVPCTRYFLHLLMKQGRKCARLALII